tara:strand:- start:680 stop:1444 length:765 start_codon:yes stop_codon:yes gene_type:complete
MCLITFQWQPNAENSLILSANRDEFFHRPTKALHNWPNIEGIYAGKDLSQGGTWLGVHKNGRFAALTNHRDMTIKEPKNPISRGNLALDFLASNTAPLEYLQSLEAKAELYAGFNLLVADKDQLVYFSNRSHQTPRILTPGIYGLSNALLDSPWPKLQLAKQQLTDWLAKKDPQLPLVGLLASTATAEDSLLPNTGIGLETERMLSCQKIISPSYGTRCSTGLIINRQHIQMDEISWQANGEKLDEKSYRIALP